MRFGTDSPLTAVGDGKGNQTSLSFNPGTLSYSTTYYWRIDAVNNVGTSTGTTWSFTTAAAASPTRYFLTVDGNPSAGGWPTFDPPPDNDGKYAAGTVVTLTANPAIGYQFSGWEGALSGMNNPAMVTMDGNKFVTANFSSAPSRYLLFLSLSPSGSGSIGASPSPGLDGKYAPGTVVTLTANPGSGYVFGSWGGGASQSSPSITVTLNSDVAVTAHFLNLSGFLPGLRRQIYTNLPGSTIADLTSSPNFPGAPDLVDSVPMIESQYLPNDAGENYGQRLTGWLVPPITGNYVFYLASDDAAQVFLSTDDNPAYKRLMVEELGWNPWRNWEGQYAANPMMDANTQQPFPQRASASIPLTAGSIITWRCCTRRGSGGIM